VRDEHLSANPELRSFTQILQVARVSEDAGSALSRDFFGYAEVNQVVHVEAVKENVFAPREPLQTVADCTATKPAYP